jgi:hypothetical protein
MIAAALGKVLLLGGCDGPRRLVPSRDLMLPAGACYEMVTASKPFP